MIHTAHGHIPNHTTDRQPQPGGPRPRALAAAALRAAAAGWAVFPVRPRGKIPAVRGWEDAATLDPDRILAWWAGTAWNIGIATGRSGLLVVDLDVPAAGAQPAAGAVCGSDALRGLAADAATAPTWDTFTVSTPSGGRHLYFRPPDAVRLRNTQGALGPLIDTRGHGGYVLAAGSRGPSSRRYRILRDVPVAPLPAWLHDALTTHLVPPGPADAPTRAADAPISHPRDDGGVPTAVSAARIDAYLRAVVDGESRAVADAPVGTRHSTLLRAARRLGRWVGSGALSGADVRTVLIAAARGYVGVDGYTAQQVERDITDGLAYGAARPRHIDDLPDRPAARPSESGR